MSVIKLEYDVNGDNFATAGEASDAVKMYLKRIGIESSIIRKVAIAMYEGEINMVIHANGGKAYVEIYSDKIKIRLVDHGKGIANIDEAMKEGFTTAPENIRSLGFGAGMGLPNMKKYSDEMEIESTVNVGTTVCMTFYVG